MKLASEGLLGEPLGKRKKQKHLPAVAQAYVTAGRETEKEREIKKGSSFTAGSLSYVAKSILLIGNYYFLMQHLIGLGANDQEISTG